jgi:hypothetical protein
MQQQVQNIFRFAGNLGITMAPDFTEKKKENKQPVAKKLLVLGNGVVLSSAEAELGGSWNLWDSK